VYAIAVENHRNHLADVFQCRRDLAIDLFPVSSSPSLPDRRIWIEWILTDHLSNRYWTIWCVQIYYNPTAPVLDLAKMVPTNRVAPRVDLGKARF
jgi:hypothetical protein